MWVRLEMKQGKRKKERATRGQTLRLKVEGKSELLGRRRFSLLEGNELNVSMSLRSG